MKRDPSYDEEIFNFFSKNVRKSNGQKPYRFFVDDDAEKYREFISSRDVLDLADTDLISHKFDGLDEYKFEWPRSLNSDEMELLRHFLAARSTAVHENLELGYDPESGIVEFSNDLDFETMGSVIDDFGLFYDFQTPHRYDKLSCEISAGASDSTTLFKEFLDDFGYQRAVSEVMFCNEIDGIRFGGIIDQILLDENSEEYIACELKLTLGLKPEHILQTESYRHAFENRFLGDRMRGVLVHLDPNNMEYVAIHDDDPEWTDDAWDIYRGAHQRFLERVPGIV